MQLFQTWNCVTLPLSLAAEQLHLHRLRLWHWAVAAKYLRWSEVSIFCAVDLLFWRSMSQRAHLPIFRLNIDLIIPPPSLPSERKLLLPALPASFNTSSQTWVCCCNRPAFKISTMTDSVRVRCEYTMGRLRIKGWRQQAKNNASHPGSCLGETIKRGQSS